MTEIGTIQTTEGGFLVDGKRVDLDTLILTLQMARADSIDKQIADQAQSMRAKNAQLKFYNQVLERLRSGMPTLDIDDPGHLPKDMVGGLVGGDVFTLSTSDTLPRVVQPGPNAEGVTTFNVGNLTPCAGGGWTCQIEYQGYAGGGQSLTTLTQDITVPGSDKTLSISMEKLFEANGFEYQTAGDSAAKETNAMAIKGLVDSLNSSSQLDMIRLQGLMNKRNQAFEMMTNVLTKVSKNKDAIIRNMT